MAVDVDSLPPPLCVLYQKLDPTVCMPKQCAEMGTMGHNINCPEVPFVEGCSILWISVGTFVICGLGNDQQGPALCSSASCL